MYNYLLWLLLIMPVLAWAHGDEAHQDEKPQASALGKSPHSSSLNEQAFVLADGALFVPKSVQRQFKIRTQSTALSQVSPSWLLNGRVVAAPNAAAVVQAMQDGRLEPVASQLLPYVGQTVKQGQVLAYLQPSLTALEQANQQSLLAELEAQQRLLTQRMTRLQAIKESIATQEIDEVNLQLQSIKQRQAVLKQPFAKEPLRASMSGVISASQARIGQVVQAQDVLFEITQPQHLWVEAQSFDSSQASISSAQLMLPNQPALNLQYISQSSVLNAQSNAIFFKILAQNTAILPKLGQIVQVMAQSQARQQGIVVPQQAVIKDTQQQSFVWLHAQAEQFVRQAVTVRPLDDKTVLVTQGLLPNQRVVIQGAYLLTQVQ